MYIWWYAISSVEMADNVRCLHFHILLIMLTNHVPFCHQWEWKYESEENLMTLWSIIWPKWPWFEVLEKERKWGQYGNLKFDTNITVLLCGTMNNEKAICGKLGIPYHMRQTVMKSKKKILVWWNLKKKKD